MWKDLKAGLASLLTSKKAIAALSGAVAAGAMRLGFNVDPETVGLVLSPVVVYVVGQTIVDRGKVAAEASTKAEAARVEALTKIAGHFADRFMRDEATGKRPTAIERYPSIDPGVR